MASSSLLTNIPAEYSIRFYLLNLVQNHATNHTRNRCASLLSSLRRGKNESKYYKNFDIKISQNSF